MIAGQFRIDLRAPGVDAATQTFDLRKAVPLKISRRIHAARALMVVDDDEVRTRPVSEELLHEFLGEKMCARQLHRVEFLARAHVEKMNGFTNSEALGQFERLDLHRAV